MGKKQKRTFFADIFFLQKNQPTQLFKLHAVKTCARQVESLGVSRPQKCKAVSWLMGKAGGRVLPPIVEKWQMGDMVWKFLQWSDLYISIILIHIVSYVEYSCDMLWSYFGHQRMSVRKGSSCFQIFRPVWNPEAKAIKLRSHGGVQGEPSVNEKPSVVIKSCQTFFRIRKETDSIWSNNINIYIIWFNLSIWFNCKLSHLFSFMRKIIKCQDFLFRGSRTAAWTGAGSGLQLVFFFGVGKKGQTKSVFGVEKHLKNSIFFEAEFNCFCWNLFEICGVFWDAWNATRSSEDPALSLGRSRAATRWFLGCRRRQLFVPEPLWRSLKSSPVLHPGAQSVHGGLSSCCPQSSKFTTFETWISDVIPHVFCSTCM